MADKNSEDDYIEWTSIIMDKNLAVANPMLVEGLVSSVPKGMKAVAALFSYDTRITLSQKVSCSNCNHPNNHYKGLVVEMEDGSKALFGHCCGEEHFGPKAWNRLNNELLVRQEEAYYKAKVAPTLKRLINVSAMLDEWIKQASILDVFIRHLITRTPELFRGVETALRSGTGRLTTTIQKRSYRVTPSGKHSPVFTPHEETVCVIPLPEFFNRNRPLSLLLQIRKDLDLAANTLKDKAASARDLKAAQIKMQRALSDLKQVNDFISSARLMLDGNIWERIIDWANTEVSPKCRPSCSWHFNGGIISQLDRKLAVKAIVAIPSEEAFASGHYERIKKTLLEE